MKNEFRTDADVATPAMAHATGCNCLLHARRRWGTAALATLAAPGVMAQGGWSECTRSGFTKFSSAAQVEGAASQQYAQMLNQAKGKGALAPMENPQTKRLRYIADRIIPFANTCNDSAKSWKWEVNLIGDKQLNAFCMPGGKIAFYFGILSELQLSDDEVAVIMGHEVSHALLEHARERMGKSTATRGAIELGAAIFGVGGLGKAAMDMGGQLLTLQYSRSDESEADALGLILAANAGYDPHAGVSLWQKMLAANKGAPPQWLSTHPSGKTRIKDMEARMASVDQMYAQASKPQQRFAPPARIGSKQAGQQQRQQQQQQEQQTRQQDQEPQQRQ